MLNIVRRQYPNSFVVRHTRETKYYKGGPIAAAFPELFYGLEKRQCYGTGVLTNLPSTIEEFKPVEIEFNPIICQELEAWKEGQKKHNDDCEDDDGLPCKLPELEDKRHLVYVLAHPDATIKDGNIEYKEDESVWVIVPNKKVYDSFMWYCEKKISFSNNVIYRWHDKDEFWEPQGKYEHMPRESVFGLDSVFEGIDEDIRTLREKKDLLKKIGRSASLNYLLHGPPGTGKTSTIKAIGSQYKMDIYIAGFNSKVQEKHIQRIMTPVVDYSAILLVEDFDRYLSSEESSKQVSTFLNALDGVEPADGIIRFFTANNPESIGTNNALLSRMQRIIRYDQPTSLSIAKRVQQVFEKASDELVQEFSKLAVEKDLSLRDVTNLLFRNVLKEDGLQDCIRQLDDFIGEKKMLLDAAAKKEKETTEE